MSKNVGLRLNGYFDRNFGDDYMFKLVAHSMPEVTFFVDAQEQDVPCLVGEPNVCFGAGSQEHLPLLTVIGSGFVINDWKGCWYELKCLLLRKEVGDFCLGCNIESFPNWCYHLLMKCKLRQYRLITCRDSGSFRWLKKHCRRSQVHYYKDILFSLPDEWLPAESSADHLGISVMNLGEGDVARRYYDCLAQAADHYIAQTGREVILLAFDSGMEDDVSACNWVKNRMNMPERAEIVAHHQGDEIFTAYARCEKIIATRFHSAVLAMRMGVEVYPIIYRDKMRNLIEDTGCPEQGSELADLQVQPLKDFVCKPGANGFCVRAEKMEHTECLRRYLKGNKT